MHLTIGPETKLKDLKKEFNEQFPVLKLEFFKQPHKEGEGNSIKEKLDPETRVHDLNPQLESFHMEFDENIKVWELEQLLKEKTGLNIQVFYKRGSSWIETTHSDEATLQELLQEQ
ncbi:MAG: hypothetical protein D6707_07920 [Bacteroidetes bacterium]|nr:MAG: hypothetical protein D6707_07920 [Bacteroidota bacterium]